MTFWVAGAMVVSSAISSSGADGGSDPSVNQSSQSTMTPEQQAMLRQLIERISGNRPSNLTAGLSGLQNTSLSAIERMALNNADNVTNMEGGGEALRTLQDSMRATPQDTAAMFKANVEDPALQDWQNNLMPQLTRQFKGSAGYGSDKINTFNTMADNFQRGLTASRTKYAYDAGEAQRNRALTAAGQIPGLNTAGSTVQNDQMSRLMMMLTAGGVPQANAQADLTNQYNADNTQINQMLAALGLKPLDNTTVVDPGSTGFLTAAAPGVGQALTNYFLRPSSSSSGSAYTPTNYTPT